jgi:GNAT superfamily N-acetyltransferase
VPGEPAQRARYRTAGLLAGTVLLGWAADTALGGGAGHSIGWLLALLLVGGIPALSAWSAHRRAADAGPPDPSADRGSARTDRRGGGIDPRSGRPDPRDDGIDPRSARPDPGSAVPGHEVRPARPDELAELIEVERAADQLFPLAGYGAVPPPADLADLAAAPGLLVSGDPPVGYARIEVVDGRAHLEGLSVRPRFMRQGRGTELVEAACRWAAVHGFDELTLCTFAEVPWNGPFYAGLGFVELAQLTPGLRQLREAERALGLDAMGRRVVLVRSLGDQPS